MISIYTKKYVLIYKPIIYNMYIYMCVCIYIYIYKSIKKFIFGILYIIILMLHI